MTPQLKIPTHDLHIASPCRSLMNPSSESHSVEIAMPRCDALVHVGGKNKLFVTIKMVNQTNFSNCEVKLWSGSARWGRAFWTRMIFNGCSRAIDVRQSPEADWRRFRRSLWYTLTDSIIHTSDRNETGRNRRCRQLR